MGIIGIILGILGAIPEIIALVVKIIGLIKGLRNDDDTYTLTEQYEDEAELRAAVGDFRKTKDASRLQKLHDRIRARRMRRNP